MEWGCTHGPRSAAHWSFREPRRFGEHSSVTTAPIVVKPYPRDYFFQTTSDKYFTWCFYSREVLISNKTFMSAASGSCFFMWTLNKTQGTKSLLQRVQKDLWDLVGCNRQMACQSMTSAQSPWAPALGGTGSTKSLGLPGSVPSSPRRVRALRAHLCKGCWSNTWKAGISGVCLSHHKSPLSLGCHCALPMHSLEAWGMCHWGKRAVQESCYVHMNVSMKACPGASVLGYSWYQRLTHNSDVIQGQNRRLFWNVRSQIPGSFSQTVVLSANIKAWQW